MKRMAFVALVAGMVLAPGLVNVLPAQAMVPSLPDFGARDMIEPAAGGCGRGMHRGPYGGCRKNFARPWRHACPRGFHVGPGGRCRGNGR